MTIIAEGKVADMWERRLIDADVLSADPLSISKETTLRRGDGK